jgi:serine/threonine protein phosphatase PrpC
VGTPGQGSGLRIRVGAETNVGRVRTNNEDAFLATGRLFAVADGMGGLEAGEVASGLAMDTLRTRVQEEATTPLAEWVREANRAIYAKAMAGMGRPGMGTTLTALMIEGGHLRAAHVGDTRGYLLRDGQLSRVTRDHSRVAQMVEDGLITEEQAAHHPERNVITRALGVKPDVQVDDFTLDVRPGDRLLLCSDGLHGMVADPAIRSILLETPDPNEAAHRLVEAANQGGGVDNITAMVLDVLPSRAGGGGGGRRAWPWVAVLALVVAVVVGIGIAMAVGGGGGSPSPTRSTPVRNQPSSTGTGSVEIPTASPAPGPSSSKAPTEVPTALPTTPST